MAKRVLALMLAVLAVFVFGSFSELAGAGSRHSGGHSGGYRGGHSGGSHGGYRGGYSGHHGGHHRGHHGGRYYWGPFIVGGVLLWPGYYSYPPSTIIIDSAPYPYESESIPPTVSPPALQENIPSPRRCQILEDGEWKDIPCR